MQMIPKNTVQSSKIRCLVQQEQTQMVAFYVLGGFSMPQL